MTTEAFDAVKKKDAGTLKRLLKQGLPADARNEVGFTLLHMAARASSPECVKALLDAGASVDAEGPWGETALMETAVQGDVEVAKLLLDAGAQIERKDARTEATPLLEAARFANTELVRLLLARGARRDAVDAAGFNALSLAQLNDHEETERVLVELGFQEQAELRESIDATRREVRLAAGKPPLPPR